MTASLIGLAYTNPAITVVAINNNLFKVHLYEKGQLTNLNLFLQSIDARKSVILVTSVEDLEQIQNIKNIHSFILFDELEILKNIDNIKILDVDKKTQTVNYVTPQFLNETLQQNFNNNFIISKKALDYRKKMTSKITFKDMVTELLEILIKLKKQNTFIEEFLIKTCQYAVNLISKKLWIKDIRNTLVSLNINVENIVELEKWLTSNTDVKNLAKAYYMIAEEGETLVNVVKKIPNVIKEDVEYVVNNIGAEKGQKYIKERKKRSK